MIEPQRVILVAEHTPNPDTVKLDAGREISPLGGAQFDDAAEAAQGSPLAARLFALGGVRRVFLGPDFVAGTKLPEASWAELGQRVIAVLRAHLEAGEPVLASGYRPSQDDPPPAGGEADAVRRVLEEEIRPALARDGGDATFVSYEAGVLELELRGACADCPSSVQTFRLGIEGRLRESIPGFRRLIAR